MKRLRRPLRADDSGVSNIVTSIMMLGIVMTILGMIMTVYVPMWAHSKEVSHMDDVSDAFMDIKIGTESQILSNDVGSKYSTRIPLGAKGGPFLGIGRTTGGLDFDAGSGTIRIYRTDDPLNVLGEGGGRLQFESNNKYYIDQHYVFENGGILLKQDERALIVAAPDFQVEKDPFANNIRLELTLNSLVGSRKSIGGSGDTVVETILNSDMNAPHQFDWRSVTGGSGQDISIKFNTFDPEVWVQYFNQTLGGILELDPDGAQNSSGGDYYIVTSTYAGADPMLEDSTDILINIRHIVFLDCELAVMGININ